MWKAFKITLGIVLGLLAIPTVIAIITSASRAIMLAYIIVWSIPFILVYLWEMS